MRVLVGISGSIAVLGIHAYLVRLMSEPGYRVSAMMTRTAAAMVNPAALGAVLREPVTVEEWAPGQALPPSALVDACDVLVVAPASATTLAWCASGVAANIVAASYLAHQGPTLFAPTMAPAMLEHPAVQRNLEAPTGYGASILPCAQGFQVSSGRWRDGALCDYAEMRAALARIQPHTEKELIHGAA